jgi:hypothetical protein
LKVPAFFKQVGSLVHAATADAVQLAGTGTFVRDKDADDRWIGRMRQRAGADPLEWPYDLRVQEFPTEVSR